MMEFCQSIAGCQRKALIKYLGQDQNTLECDKKCQNCINGINTEEIDMLNCGKIILDIVSKREIDFDLEKFGLNKEELIYLCFSKKKEQKVTELLDQYTFNKFKGEKSVWNVIE